MPRPQWKAPEARRPLIATILIGLSAGFIAVAFASSVSWVAEHTVIAASHKSPLAFAGLTLGFMALGAFITGWLMWRFAPDAAGSGIPQVKVAYHTRHPDFGWKLLAVKFFGGVLSIGTGSSLGREGPTIHMGAALANKIARFLGEPEEARLNAVCAGSAAGLAVAFNSPLAGVTLVLEEIAGGANQHKYAGRSLLAAALGVLVVYLFLGDHAAFNLPPGLPLTWPDIWLSPLVALVAGAGGLAFQASTLRLRGFVKHSRIPTPIATTGGALVGAAAGIAGFWLTGHLGVFGLGEQDLLATMQNQIIWSTALWLLLAKLVATTFCYGSGGCGGIFAPLIFFGGMSGTVVFGLTQPWLHLTTQDQTMLSIIGMTACLCSVVRAPITSILIVTEMTREVYVLPALMIAAVIGAYLNRYCLGENLYDASLLQDGIRIDGD